MKFRIPKGNLLGSDTETTGLYWRFTDRPYCFSFANADLETSVLSFDVNPFTREVIYDDRLDLLRDVYQDPSIAKTFHNAAFDVGMIESTGIKVRGEIIDTMNLIRLVMPGAPIKLKPFCMQYLNIQDDDEKDLKEATRIARLNGEKLGWRVFHSRKTTKKQEDSEIAADYWMAGNKYYEPYCIKDSIRCISICRALWPGIKELGIEKLWINEQETFKVLRDIEKRGIRIFKDKVEQNTLELKKKLQMYRKKAIQKIILPLKVKTKTKVKILTKSKEINLNSPQQLSAIFYDRFKEPIVYLTKKAKNPATDNAALGVMKCPIAKDILNMKACEKTLQFMAQYKHFMVQHKDGNWYIHPNLHQSLAVTGRESCSDPNLQQVASGEKETKNEVRVEARSVFGSRPNYTLRSYDWKNIEVYIPGFASRDTKITAMLRAGKDVHEHTSKELTRRTETEINRFEAKRTFFGWEYGIGSAKLSKTLGISKDLAALIILEMKHEYPEFSEFLDVLIMQARTTHYITTAYGRKIYIPPEEAYKAPNYYIQGTAGGILKFAKVKAHHALRKKDAFIVLPVHDELLVEIGDGTSVDEIDRIIVDCMQDNPELNMPVKIPVAISSIGANWAEKIKVATL